MSKLMDNLNIIKTQKQSIKDVISAMGFDTKNLTLSGYAGKLSVVQVERVEIKKALSAAGVSVGADLSTAINDAIQNAQTEISALCGVVAADGIEMARMSAEIKVYQECDLSDHEAVKRLGELSGEYDALSVKYDILSAGYDSILAEQISAKAILSDILGC